MPGRWMPRRNWRCPTRAIATAPTRPFHQLSTPSIQSTQRRQAIARRSRNNLQTNHIGTRTLFTESLPPVLIPPAIFLGLLLALWTWKCFWIVVLQDKLLYLSWLPPLSRSESISDYEGEFRGVKWTERSMRSLDGTRLAVCEGRVSLDPPQSGRLKRLVIVCYFQGNGGSTPLRLPLLSQVLGAMKEASAMGPGSGDAEYVLVALSYRGYWKSGGRATQSGIELDAEAFLAWVSETYGQPGRELRVVLWGHSLGAAVASSAVVKRLACPATEGAIAPPIAGLVLEAPISSIKDMLVSLYPQKWLPYRYLWPFSWNKWDIAETLEQMAIVSRSDSVSGGRAAPPIFLLSADSDEVIPMWVADQLEDKARSLGLDIQRKSVKSAMHIEGPLKLDGRKALVDFIINSGNR
ncbi:Alpha/Beta hydrolase protein [Aspergillus aurantiobrunneus]